MSWKAELQVGDLDCDQKLDLTCKKCGHIHFVTTGQLLAHEGARYLYLDEIEQKSRCSARGCGGHVHVAINHQKKMNGFVGGMA